MLKLKKILDKFNKTKQNITISSFVTKIFWLKANNEIHYENIESDGNMCRHIKAKKITVSKQKFSYRFSLKQKLDLVRIRISTPSSALKAKIFKVKINEIEIDGNMCRHTKADEMNVFNQKVSCKFSLVRKLDLLKGSVSTSLYAFATKIFWLKAEVLNILDNEIAIEKIRKYTTLAPKEITNRVTPSLNAKRNIVFK